MGWDIVDAIDENQMPCFATTNRFLTEHDGFRHLVYPYRSLSQQDHSTFLDSDGPAVGAAPPVGGGAETAGTSGRGGGRSSDAPPPGLLRR